MSLTALRPLSSILIANRGEIALRVGRTAAASGIRVTTLYTDPDAQSQHALSTPFAVNLGAPPAYLDGARIIAVAKQEACAAIHPGYGFLSENAAFARAVTDAGLVFIGPPWKAIEAMGSKSRSKEIMSAAGVPCVPGYHGAEQSEARLAAEADKIGYPVLLKAVKGGGGKGMRIVRAPGEFAQALQSAKSEARSSFGDDAMLVERYIGRPRHVEVQVFADKHGNCVALGERDCSVQRRHQKILEESPAPHLSPEVREDLWDKARRAALAVGYEGAGTVEFILDTESGDFFFMEMNTRLQVEHPVTEAVTGQDLVQWQLLVAAGEPLPLSQADIAARIASRGHAVEARIYAEDPARGFVPDSGRLLHLRLPLLSPDVRIDAGFVAGDTVSSHYDPMIAKLIVRGETRAAALQKMRAALEEYEIAGPATNIEFLKRVVSSPPFVAGDLDTGFIERHRAELFAHAAAPAEVLAQAALGVLLQEEAAGSSSPFGPAPLSAPLGFTGSSYSSRAIRLLQPDPAGVAPPTASTVTLQRTAPHTYTIVVSTASDASTGSPQTFAPVTATLNPDTHVLTSFYPHTRLATTLVTHPDASADDGAATEQAAPQPLTLFQRGAKFGLQVAAPGWAERALRSADAATSSVRAPMPCRVLSVRVKAGERVEPEQVLVVVESMKMEMVVRAGAGGGVVRRVVHGEGDIVAAGTALVEFEDEEDGAAADAPSKSSLPPPPEPQAQSQPRPRA
ncbi:uncharacterized protein K452DRAFT_233201 [Aplosporella prunicola CBS 121167]|uniref:3-methylcrotonyl-CoA carboxylase subunit alpha n=1 Tax=Aplosporella prunicola CBS 121167 TaxID=1176127 RepID=A0A6A6B5F9_9PEZI|nr:uncharacterized protein K452DRAFT_233201 [Aplosporella prunicola CBS 121167]KAF2139086.1 hypothetical protein K452DRAFT_233201 [Aplosporella prunicola CBS 121167]